MAPAALSHMQHALSCAARARFGAQGPYNDEICWRRCAHQSFADARLDCLRHKRGGGWAQRLPDRNARRLRFCLH